MSTMRAQRSKNGFTLIEMLLVVAILGMLLTIVSSLYSNYRTKQYNASTMATLLNMSTKIDLYYVQNNQYPNQLSDVFPTTILDPWGNPFIYLKITGSNTGSVRKDKNLHPINTDYDLYSMGEDEQTATQISSSTGRDDIVRANNGNYVGLGKDY